ncbi:MAG TPA: right-handed parallel beta-helix repeat-containing protein, partial [Candidatus Hydrogenedentes bacterium]|nr:right-handed parallel beta-helix repeat-containing protein [Candidatus Hydrogenedentota bacterium]
IDHTYTPAVLAGGVGVRVSHNLMHHINSSALRVNGNDHLIELNEAHNVLLESDDQGGADMWGDPTFLGNVYRHNYWHHLGNWRRDAAAELGCGQAGIRLDDAISGVLIEGNIFHKASAGKTGFGGVQIHGGKDNLLLNNVFSDCEAAVSFSPWGEERWREFITPRIDSDAIDPALYAGRYPVYSGLWDNANRNHLKGNIALHCGKLTLRAPKNVLQEGTLTDPPASLFAAPDRGDFAMNTAAARRAGVPVIPFERIGLYKDAFRKELPSEEVAAARAEQ